MAPDPDAFEGVYRRLAVTGLAGGTPHDVPRASPPEAGPSQGRATPRSRLLPRLVLMAPRRRPTSFER